MTAFMAFVSFSSNRVFSSFRIGKTPQMVRYFLILLVTWIRPFVFRAVHRSDLPGAVATAVNRLVPHAMRGDSRPVKVARKQKSGRRQLHLKRCRVYFLSKKQKKASALTGFFLRQHRERCRSDSAANRNGPRTKVSGLFFDWSSRTRVRDVIAVRAQENRICRLRFRKNLKKNGPCRTRWISSMARRANASQKRP